ncbi:MAG: hemolysin family protein [Flavobacteriales bacterium]
MNYIYIFILFTLIFSAYFSGMEMAYISCNKLHIELEKNKGRFSAKIISRFLENPSKFIATMLIGNNIALVFYGLQMSIILDPLLNKYIVNSIVSLLLTTLISTIIVLITAEFLPKAIFKKYANPLLNALSIPTVIFYYILSPIVFIFSLISNGILKLFGQEVGKEEIGFDRDDLEDYLYEHTSNLDSKEEVETEIQILQNALDFSKVKARECMVHRTEIIGIDVNESIESLQKMFIETGLSKIIVYEKDIDHIIGFAHCFKLFTKPNTIREIIHQTIPIPESMLASEILKKLTTENKSIAIVYDEFGGTSGLVCLEDVIEEIFGEIEDEHDSAEFVEEKIDVDSYRLSARLDIDEINQKLDWDLPESEEYETLSGLIIQHLEDIPIENQELQIRGYFIKIIKVEAMKINEVIVTKG